MKIKMIDNANPDFTILCDEEGCNIKATALINHPDYEDCIFTCEHHLNLYGPEMYGPTSVGETITEDALARARLITDLLEEWFKQKEKWVGP